MLPLLAPVTASAEPLCMRWIERDFALESRRIFDASNRKTPRDAFNVLREPFGPLDASSFVFTNRAHKGQVSRLLLVLPGSAFHPAYLLENIERAVPANTEVAVFEYPYLQPGVDPRAAFVASDEIVRQIASGLDVYRQRHIQTEKDPPLGRRYIHHERYVRVDSPGCRECAIRSGAFANYLRPPRVRQAPVFLGAYEAYFWGTLSDGDGWLGGYPWTAKDLEPRQRREVLRRLSANLPTWAYIYIPFDEKIAPYPHILHQGRELIFVEPGFDDPPEE